ncbi:hypothetical protein SYNPS1DRAFT_22501 [Syncephalis pseudoplumigaleata]|uniref:Vacuolar import and degradation protein 21 n=1 Tax=Syncephalis pseudoplumigaleata TaxID=1712513 RepID=A0A4P9Z284_9FUNG|nr:hypothetical protein SYNPS1DRAFT_22501 [Syncephalis pseudoplumigaleata]|eukprot:RKP25560.1 hypothetical protein SYNPS1DRAFT_22501 [Syncephalis pseudoplumigaleata]
MASCSDDGAAISTERALLNEAHAAADMTIPSKRPRTAAPIERMVTRGVSGAIRHKHISELTGGFIDGPRQSSPGMVSPELRPDMETDLFRPNEPLQPADGQRPRPPHRKHSRQPSVRVRIKQAPQRTTTPTKRPSISGQARAKSSAIERMRANMLAWQIRAEHQPLYKQVQSAKKVVSSQEWKRVEQLKEASMWSLRQPKRHKAPPRTKTHWDYVLDEMKWLRTDFKEERKWKRAMAYYLARWVRDWHCAEDKQALQVKTRPPRFLPQPQGEDAAWADTSMAAATPGSIGDAADDGAVAAMQLDSEPALLSDSAMEEADASMNVPEASPFIHTTTVDDQGQTASPGDLMLTKQYDSTETAMPALSHTIEPCPALLADARQAMHILHTLPMYTIPEPGDADAYLDDIDMGQVVPITKLLSSGPPAKELFAKQTMMRRFTDRIRANMPNFVSRNRYSPSACELFTTRKAKDLGPVEVVLPSGRNDHYVKLIDAWTPEQDRMLNLLVEQYGFNWQLIAECMNGHRNLAKGGYSAQSCCDRWLHQNQGKSDQPTLIPVPHPSGQAEVFSETEPVLEILAQSKQRKDTKQKATKDTKKRASKAITLQDAFRKASKRREQLRKNAITAAEEKERVLAGRQVPGIDITSQTPTPRILGQLRISRELQLTRLLAQQAQIRAYGGGIGPIASHAQPAVAIDDAQPYTTWINGTLSLELIGKVR